MCIHCRGNVFNELLPGNDKGHTSQSQNQNYFRTGGLPLISSSWRQAPWDPRKEIFSTEPLRYSRYEISSMRRWGCLLWICLAFRQEYVWHMYHIIENSSFCTIRKSSVSAGFAEQIMRDTHTPKPAVACILCNENMSTEPLCSNDMRGYSYGHRDWWEVLMKYVVEMGSGGMMYTPDFIKMGSDIQKLRRGIHRHREHEYRIRLI
jgi:hypothetical protein